MDSWNSFMQSREARIVLYGVCVAFTLYYAIDAILELLDPVRSASLIETLGATTFYLMDIGRAVVCLITGIAFGRMLYRLVTGKDE